MEHLTAYDWLTIASFFLAIISIAINVFQWKKSQLLDAQAEKQFMAGLSAGFYAIWDIAVICDKAREHIGRSQSEGVQEDLFPFIQSITGAADASRNTMNALCRELIGRSLYYESVWDVARQRREESVSEKR